VKGLLKKKEQRLEIGAVKEFVKHAQKMDKRTLKKLETNFEDILGLAQMMAY
jgi:hypothetical protein